MFMLALKPADSKEYKDLLIEKIAIATSKFIYLRKLFDYKYDGFSKSVIDYFNNKSRMTSPA